MDNHRDKADKEIIRVKDLSKKFLLHNPTQQNLKERLTDLFKPSSAKKQLPRSREFWALKDISFNVKVGEVIGIIGPNGSGKSTLLKILSGITEPTLGEVEVRGKVSSLLEVGTGFHPELTGRQNIFLSGSLLGMKRREVKEKFDEIVAFSGVEDFIDIPVKWYSTGMRTRLAFSVSAHLEAEILIIDEVLSVGDAEFRRKCLQKVRDLTQKSDITIILVSHNMNEVMNFCHRVFLLENGSVAVRGKPGDTVLQYVEKSFSKESEGNDSQEDADPQPVVSKEANPPVEGNGKIKTQKGIHLHGFSLEVPGKTSDEPIRTSDPIRFRFSFSRDSTSDEVKFGIRVKDHLDNDVFLLSPTEEELEQGVKEGDQQVSACVQIPGDFLNKGFFLIDLIISDPDGNWLYYEADIVSFKVLLSEKRTSTLEGYFGPMLPFFDWTIKSEGKQETVPGN